MPITFNIDPFNQREKREAKQDQRLLDRLKADRKAIRDEQNKLDASLKGEREASALAFAQSDPATRSAIGFDPSSAQSQGLLSGLASADPVSRSLAGAAVGNLQAQEQEIAGRQRLALDVRGLQLRNKATKAQLRNLDQQFSLVKSGVLTPEARQSMIRDARDGFTKAMEPVGEVLVAFQQTDNLLATGESLGAQLAIVKMAKLSDPGSTVRIEEGKMVSDGVGLSQTIANEFNKMAGQGFTETAVIQFRNAMRDLAGPRALSGQNTMLSYLDFAKRNGIDVRDIFVGSGIDTDLLSNLAMGQTAINNRNNVEFSTLNQTPNTGTIQR